MLTTIRDRDVRRHVPGKLFDFPEKRLSPVLVQEIVGRNGRAGESQCK